MFKSIAKKIGKSVFKAAINHAPGVGVLKAVVSGSEKPPRESKWDDAGAEIGLIFVSFKQKHDSDGDGNADWTPQEVTEFLAQVFTVVSKYL